MFMKTGDCSPPAFLCDGINRRVNTGAVFLGLPFDCKAAARDKLDGSFFGVKKFCSKAHKSFRKYHFLSKIG